MADENPKFEPYGRGVRPPGSRLGSPAGPAARSQPAARPSSILPKLLLREEEDRTVRDLLDATTDVMVISERHSLQLVYANQGAIRQLRYSREELLAMTAMQLQPGIPKADYQEIVDGVAPGQWVTYTTAFRRKDGSEVDMEVTLEDPKASKTASPRLISVARDISNRVQAERRMRQAERDIAVFDERQRIARDLHDSVIQRLFAAGLAATSIIERIADDVVRERIEQVVHDLDATIHDLRASIFELAPLTRRPLLRSRVIEICSAECDMLQMTSNVHFEGAVDTVAPSDAEELLAVLREALSNVARHANATMVDVSLSVDGEVSLCVKDDGTGISEGPGRTFGHGLANMAARARDLGGVFDVRSEKDRGSRIDWRIPRR